MFNLNYRLKCTHRETLIPTMMIVLIIIFFFEGKQICIIKHRLFVKVSLNICKQKVCYICFNILNHLILAVKINLSPNAAML